MITGGAAVVFFAAVATALATGLGALPFAFHGRRVARWLGPANAVAAGVMLGASASLVIEGVERSGGRTAVGAIGGAAFVYSPFASSVGTMRSHSVRFAAPTRPRRC